MPDRVRHDGAVVSNRRVNIIHSPMHLRINTTKRADKIYRYVQIVQNVKDKNGKSTTRVFKHLGVLPDTVIDAFRLALKAGQNKIGH